MNEISIENVNAATTPEKEQTPATEEDITNDESHTKTDNILEFVTSAKLSSRSPIVRPGAETCASKFFYLEFELVNTKGPIRMPQPCVRVCVCV